MSTKNTRKVKVPCPECGSNLEVEDGYIYCTQHLFENHYPELFQDFDASPEDKLKDKLAAHSFKVYDIYQRWKFIDPETGERTQFCCTYNPNVEFNPMTQSETVLPDPAQTKIAETLLKRELTVDEYFGNIKVPLISEKGLKYYGQVTQMVYPRDFISKYKEGRVKTDFSETPVIFTWKDLEEMADENDEQRRSAAENHGTKGTDILS